MQCMHTTLKTRFCWRYSRLHLPTIWLKTFESLLGGIVGAGTFFGWSSHLRLGFSSRGYILGCSQHLALRLQIGNSKLKRWWFLVSHGGPNRLSWGSDDVWCLTGSQLTHFGKYWFLVSQTRPGNDRGLIKIFSLQCQVVLALQNSRLALLHNVDKFVAWSWHILILG